MIGRELLAIAGGNVWRTKLRTGLTMAGVAVGIGALVSMFSFAVGMQRTVTQQFECMGLFRMMQVLPATATADSAGAAPGPVLDEAALERIRAVEGVRSAYPQQTFDAEFTFLRHNNRKKGTLQALPPSYMEVGPRAGLIAGDVFHDDSSAVAVLEEGWVESIGVDPDSVLGDTIRVRVAGSAEILIGLGRHIVAPLGIPDNALDKIQNVAMAAYRRFRSNELTVRVVGVANVEEAFGFRVGDVFVPTETVRGLDYLPFSSPLELVSMMSDNGGIRAAGSAGWPMVIVILEREKEYDRVKGAIAGLGFKVFSFMDQFEEMRKSFLVFDGFIAALGSIALFVAALGIVNTMVMSTLERTREIGILKSLGAQERHIRLLFLLESSLIGFFGSLGGLLLGWGVSRLASVIARAYIARQGGPEGIDPFHIPLWLAGGAILFGVLLSVVSGLYPASRAAAVDPVHALRHD